MSEQLYSRFPGLQDYCDDRLKLRVRKLEFARRNWADKRRKARLAAWGVALVLAVFFLKDSRPLWESLLGMAVIAGLVGHLGGRFAASFLEREQEGDVQAELLTGLCQFLKLGYEKAPRDFHLYGFQQLGLVPEYGSHEMRNRIYGNMMGLNFELAEMLLTRARTQKNDEEGSEEPEYQAILIRLPAARQFEGRTVILDRDSRLESSDGRYQSFQNHDSGDAQFARYFETMGTVPGEVQSLLPDEAIAGLVALRRMEKVRSLRGAFVNGNFLLAVEYADRPFGVDVKEIDFRKSDIVAQYCGGLSVLIGMLDNLLPIAVRRV